MIVRMHDRDELARLEDEENRAEFAIRREEEAMAAEEQRLEQEMKDFEAAEERTKKAIEAELREEHWGHDPPRPPAWRERPPSD